MVESPPKASVRGSSRHVCPRCSEPVVRSHRRSRDRLLGLFQDVRRYRCRAPDCGWHGLLRDPSPPVAGAGGARWRAALMVVGATLLPVLVVSSIMYWNTKRDRPEPPSVGFTSVGSPLPADDPRAENSARAGTLRRGCVWAGPGDAAYLGTLATALTAARVPPDVVRKFETMREEKLISDRLEITSAGIGTSDHRRNFGHVASAMTVGEILCFSTRVNPPAGTIFAADLYETLDESGRRYAIMIVTLGGNVAVLDEQAER